uniref:Uncharacterized protein n=1 Tax=Rhizophora mucronata TaxID=61149 RepID=A0A2P2PI29_RHIMU
MIEDKLMVDHPKKRKRKIIKDLGHGLIWESSHGILRSAEAKLSISSQFQQLAISSPPVLTIGPCHG